MPNLTLLLPVKSNNNISPLNCDEGINYQCFFFFLFFCGGVVISMLSLSSMIGQEKTMLRNGKKTPFNLCSSITEDVSNRITDN